MKNKKILFLILIILFVVIISISTILLVIFNVAKKDINKEEPITVVEEKKFKTHEDLTIGYSLKYDENWKQDLTKDYFFIGKNDNEITFEQLDYTDTEGVLKSTDEETYKEYSKSYKEIAIEDGWTYISDKYTVKGNLMIFECELQDQKYITERYKIYILIEKQKDKMLSFEYTSDTEENYNKYMNEVNEIINSVEFK